MTGPESRRPFNGHNFVGHSSLLLTTLLNALCMYIVQCIRQCMFPLQSRWWIANGQQPLSAKENFWGEDSLPIWHMQCIDQPGKHLQCNIKIALLMHYISTTFSTTFSAMCSAHMRLLQCNAPHVVRLITRQYQDVIVNVQQQLPPAAKSYHLQSLQSLWCIADGQGKLLGRRQHAHMPCAMHIVHPGNAILGLHC